MRSFLILLIILAATLIPFALMWAASDLRTRDRKKEGDARMARLRAAQADQLAQEAARTLMMWGWERFPSARKILSGSETWTDHRLLETLDALFEEMNAEDRSIGKSGRSSNHFDFHDSGLSALGQVLRDRLGVPQPWPR